MREIFQLESSLHDENVLSMNNDGSMIVSTRNGKVTINDKNGKRLHDIQTESNQRIFATDWSINGNTLVIVYQNLEHVIVWNKSNNDTYPIRIGFRDPAFLLWSSKNEVFALGTKKGNLVICNTMKRNTETILGKHSSEITCGTWTDDDILVLGSKDKTISFSNHDGQTIEIISLNSNPKAISHACFDECCYIAADIGSEVYFIKDVKLKFARDDSEQIKVVAYPPNVGTIKCHFWQSDCSSILIGTSKGKFILQRNPLLPNKDDNGYKILEFSVQVQKSFICCVETQSFVLVDDKDNVQILQYRDNCIEEHSSHSIDAINFLKISRNGDVLLASSSEIVHGFLCHDFNAYCSFGSNVAFLSSHQRLTIADEQSKITHLELGRKFSVLGLGPFHLGVGYGNKVHIYALCGDLWKETNEMIPMNEEVKELRLNSKYLVVQTQTTIYVHELGRKVENIEQLSNHRSNNICCFIMTTDLIIYGTLEGDLCFIHLPTMKNLCGVRLKHQSSIVDLCSNDTGTIVVFSDDNGKGFIYDTFNQELLPISTFPSCKSFMWDQSYANVFHVFDGQEFHSFVFYQTSIRGSKVAKVGNICIGDNGEITMLKKSEGCKVISGLIPMVCQRGEVLCQSRKDGNLVKFESDTFAHEFLRNLKEEEKYSFFSKYLILNCLQDAWLYARDIDSSILWKALGNKALEMMNIPVAIIAFQNLKEVATVAKLEEIQNIEEKNLLSGHLATIFGDFELAETKFLMSSTPFEALEMRCNFGQWNDALSLAINYFPNEIKRVSIALAVELELTGDLKSSLEVLEQALKKQYQETSDNYKVLSMICKLSLRLGNTTKALTIAENLKSPTLYSQMAAIVLEVQNDLRASAHLYELGQQIPNAIELWLQEQNLERVSQLLQNNEVSMDSHFYNKYALLCRKFSKFELAIEAYEIANNIEDAAKLCLTALKDPKRALHILRNKPCKSVAWEASELCKRIVDYESAIEFLLLGGYHDDAFELASTSQNVDTFVSLVGDRLPSNLSEYVGSYYDSTDRKLLAAQFFSQSSNCACRALDIYVQLNLLQEAIDLVKDNQHLEDEFILLLQSDNLNLIEKKLCLHQYYLDMNNCDEALTISNYVITESIANNDYERAYDVACKTMIKLHTLRVPIMSQFQSLFNLLHSYHLAKKFIQKADHESAAPLLIRICEHIDMFPTNDHLNIYIGTVIACHKCGWNGSALKYSRLICSEKELKVQLEKSSFRRKIESILRRVQEPKAEERQEFYLCPKPVGLAFPMCISSGRFLDQRLDWTFCTVSNMPAQLPQYIKFIDVFGIDPIIGKTISSSDVKKATIKEVNEYITQSHCFDKVEVINID